MRYLSSIQAFISGEVLNREEVRRYYGIVIMIAVLALLYIFQGIRCQNEYRKLANLQKELKDAHYELITQQSKLTKLTQQSYLANELKERGSNLRTNQEPIKRIR